MFEQESLRKIGLEHLCAFEKGIDVFMAVETLQIGLDDKIDIAILVTGTNYPVANYFMPAI